MSSALDWHPVELPYLFERQIAFCIPSGDRVVAMSYEGLHDIRLGPPVSVSTDESRAEDYTLYDADHLTMSLDGCRHPALGLHGGCPHPTARDGLSLIVDPDANVVEVHDVRGDLVIFSDHNDYPPGWLAASFSEDGSLLVIGTPDDLWCWKRRGPARSH